VCRANSGWNVIRISAFDTPAFTGEWVPDYLLDLLIGEEWVEERRARWGVRSPLWQSKVEGDFPDQSADALFPPAILYPAVNRRLRNPGTAPGTFGLDVAREGEDRSVLYRQRGGYVTEELVSYEPDTMVLADDVARTVGNKNLAIKVDATGLGGPVADRLRQLGHDAQDFVSGHSPNDPSRFDTARSEAYWHLRELMEQEAISIPDDDDLLNELGQMKYAISDRSRISVESKKDYKRRTRSPSPDKADALVYTFVDVYDYTSTDRFDFNSHKNLEHGQDAITKNAEKEGFYVGEDMVAAIGLDNIMTRPW
jgi:hypothetical protein